MSADIVITLCQVGFTVTLIPALRSTDKPPVSTSLPTGILLFIMGVALLTVDGLLYGPIVNIIVALQWFVLAWQKWRAGR